MSQNVTLTKTDQRDLPKIKALLLQGKSQLEISIAINRRRETVNRKIQKWMKTDDFKDWVKEVWLDAYTKVVNKDPVEVFRQLSRILGQVLSEKADLTGELNEIILKWQQNDANPNNTVQTT